MSNMIEITLENAQQVLIDGSQEKLVVVDFWAPWCEPCQQLMPVLDKLAAEYDQLVTFAKVNCDEQQQIAAQFGVRSLPTVAVIKNGQPIDGFAGVQPESAIKEILQKHLPSELELKTNQANELLGQSKFIEAATILTELVKEHPENVEVKLNLTLALLELTKLEAAKALLDTIPLVAQNDLYHQLVSKLALLEQAQQSPELLALEKSVSENPDSPELLQDLAIAYSQANREQEALDILFAMLKKDLAILDAKKNFLDIIANLPAGDPVASQYRKKLYTLLY